MPDSHVGCLRLLRYYDGPKRCLIPFQWASIVFERCCYFAAGVSFSDLLVVLDALLKAMDVAPEVEGFQSCG